MMIAVMTRYWRLSSGQLYCFSDRDTVRRITDSGLYAAHPGTVAIPLNRLGRFIAALLRPVVIRR